YELSDQPLTQETYFNMMQDFLQQDDILIAEQGTSSFGAYDLALYKDNTFIGQPLWGSIGYTLPATLGTQIANPYRRNILLIGD
ncbi:thiamine pyrophosphate-dependent enzyme, partial [Staphylococcus caprae]|uniref:thiamine pyrophosphate-dependent enzyme n=1 Tax=Staphylococcus caprae TaxID=29380 RepID=UPI0030BC243F